MICHVCKGATVEKFCTKNAHTIFRCTQCRLLFVHPLPRSTADIYEADYFGGAQKGFGYVEYDADKEPMIPTFMTYLSHIRRLLGKEVKLLDVGAATGFFVGLAKKEGFDAQGIEISEHAAAKARDKGFDVKTGTLSDVSGVFDCITMLDVIEHVPDPRSEILKAAALLRKDGALVVNTPDSGSLVARLLGKHWHLIVPPEHLYYFNRNTMRALLEEAGFSVVLEKTIGKSFTPQYILKTLYKWTHVTIFDWLARACQKTFLGRLSIPLNLHDNMFVIARKHV